MTHISIDQATVASQPLAGYKVLDFTRVLSGPFCSMQLGDLGADVVKIENPQGGDDTRSWRPPEAGGESFYYLALNRNKKGIVLDLARPEGRRIATELAADCDILLENFRPGVMRRLGLDYETLSKTNPKLIYCSISAYGQVGCMSERPGYDPIIQAEFGMMSITGEVDGAPLRTNVPVVDTFAALYGTIGILAATVARAQTGRGQHIDISLMATGAAVLSNNAQHYFVSGKNPPKMGNSHPNAVPAGLYYTSKGPVYIAPSNDKLFNIFCKDVLEQPRILNDDRFATIKGRVQNAVLVRAWLQDLLDGFDRDELLERMRKFGVPGGAVRTVGEALESPELREAGMVVTVDHPSAGALRMVGSPIKLSNSPCTVPSAPPMYGQHTDAVLKERLNYGPEDIAALRRNKVII